MDLFQMLIDDHEKVKNGLREIIAQGERGDRVDGQKLKNLCNELLAHMKMEEEYLYPVTCKINSESKDLTEDAFEEHDEGRELMNRISRENISSSGDISDVRSLLDVITHHTNEEENEMFPIVRRNCSQEQLDEITRQMQQLKKQELARMSSS